MSVIDKRIEHLNTHYSGTFRKLTPDEVKKYSKHCTQTDSTWEEPYAIREETNDIVCTSDSANNYSDYLFKSIK